MQGAADNPSMRFKLAITNRNICNIRSTDPYIYYLNINSTIDSTNIIIVIALGWTYINNVLSFYHLTCLSYCIEAPRILESSWSIGYEWS